MTRAARAGALALALAGLSTPASAQVRPPARTADTSETARYRDLLVGVRDSIHPVSAAIITFRRDLSSAGPETVTAKAAELVRACGRARAALVTLPPRLEPSAAPPRARSAADALRQATRELDHQLRDDCERGLRFEGLAGAPDSLRAWGPYRTARLRQTITRFDAASNRFASAVGFKVPIPGR